MARPTIAPGRFVTIRHPIARLTALAAVLACSGQDPALGPDPGEDADVPEAPAPPPAPPAAALQYACEPRASWCSELTCTFDATASDPSDGGPVGFRWYFRRYLPEDRESETAVRTGARVTHTYTQTRCRAYTYYATLEIIDADGGTETLTEQVDPSRR